MSKHFDLSHLKDGTPGARFNYLHRHRGDDRHYASDLDLVLVHKHPNPHITAFIEFKNSGEDIRFTQAVIFDALSAIAPIFIVESDTDLQEAPFEDHRFTIKRFDTVIDFAPSPPEVACTTVATDVPWGYPYDIRELADADGGFFAWEDAQRRRSEEFYRGEEP